MLVETLLVSPVPKQGRFHLGAMQQAHEASAIPRDFAEGKAVQVTTKSKDLERSL